MPVEASVAAILRPTWPDLPMPVTMTRPRALADQLDRGDEGCPSPSRIAAASAVMPAASASSVRSAEAIEIATVHARLPLGA